MLITLSIISSLIASIVLIFTIIFVMYKDWRDQINRYYSYFGAGAFVILFSMYLTYSSPESTSLTFFNRLSQLGTIMSFSAMMTLSIVFPKREKPFPVYYTLLILVPAIVSSFIIMLTDFTITRAYFKDGHLVRDFSFYYNIYAGMAFAYLLAGVVNFVRKYIKIKIAVYRLQMRFVFVGTSVAMLIAAVFSIILPRFYNYTDLYVLGPSIASFIGVGSLFYSIISYNLMDIRTVVHKTLTYTVISMAIFVPLYLILGTYAAGYRYIGSMPADAVAVIIVLIFLIFSIFLQPIIDRAFKRRQYEFERIIDTFIRDVQEERDFESTLKRSVDILFDSLFLKRAMFIMFDNVKKKYEIYYERGENLPYVPLERNSTVIRWFVRNQDILHVDRVYTDDRAFGELRGDFAGFFSQNAIKIIIPLYHERTLLGLLCLGEKDSLAAYKPDEIEKLSFFRTESNVHISNALTYEESKRKQLIARSMSLSSEVLSRSVPTALPNLAGIKFGAFIVPRHGEGIDYFDFIRPVNHGVGVVATDIAGVGINSAISSIILRSAFQSCMEEAPSAYSVIQKLNRAVYEFSEGRSGLITAYYMYYDLRSTRLIYSNAGFPPLEIFRVEKNDFDSLDTEGIPLGYDPHASYGMGRTNLLRGDIGVIYSKALITSKNQKGEAFGLLNLRAVIRESRAERPPVIAERIKERFTTFIGLLSPESDIVVIVFKIT
jgi:serine phosphatase RsbU (regulator of sigma subunit)